MPVSARLWTIVHASGYVVKHTSGVCAYAKYPPFDLTANASPSAVLLLPPVSQKPDLFVTESELATSVLSTQVPSPGLPAWVGKRRE